MIKKPLAKSQFVGRKNHMFKMKVRQQKLHPAKLYHLQYIALYNIISRKESPILKKKVLSS